MLLVRHRDRSHLSVGAQRRLARTRNAASVAPRGSRACRQFGPCPSPEGGRQKSALALSVAMAAASSGSGDGNLPVGARGQPLEEGVPQPLAEVSFRFPSFRLLSGEAWPAKLAFLAGPMNGACLFWDVRCIQGFMMRHVQSAFPKKARWLCNNWKSIRSFLTLCGLPETHSQRGCQVDCDSRLTEGSVSEFAVVPLLLRWSRSLLVHGGGAAAESMADCLMGIAFAEDRAFEIVPDATFVPTYGPLPEGVVTHTIVLVGGKLLWDDDDDMPPILRHALWGILGPKYSKAADEGIELPELLRACKLHRQGLYANLWFIRQIIFHLGMLLRGGGHSSGGGERRSRARALHRRPPGHRLEHHRRLAAAGS